MFILYNFISHYELCYMLSLLVLSSPPKDNTGIQFPSIYIFFIPNLVASKITSSISLKFVLAGEKILHVRIFVITYLSFCCSEDTYMRATLLTNL